MNRQIQCVLVIMAMMCSLLVFQSVVSALAEVEVRLNDAGFVSYDHFLAELVFYNHDSKLQDVMVFGILEIYGQFYYWPGFGSDVDFEITDIDIFKSELSLLELNFPNINDAIPFGPMRLYGAWYHDIDNYDFDVQEFWLGDDYKWTPTPVPTQVPIIFVQIPAGMFQMGSSPEKLCRDDDEGPVHSVTLSRGFDLQQTEVTQKQWVDVFGINPSVFQGINRPVENVTWFDACIFCNRMSVLEGLTPCYYADDSFSTVLDGTPPVRFESAYWNQSADGYRLPTEAEWEYACRAGTTTSYYNNTEITSCYDEDPNLNSIGWYRQNAKYETHDVGTKQSNEWNIYDMLGNVDEWCWDRYGAKYYQVSPATDPTGPAKGEARVLRGGSWLIYPSAVRSTERGFYDPSIHREIMGFRMARSTP